MRKRICLLTCIVATFLFLNGCQSQNVNNIQIVFFDLNNFNKSDTLLIVSVDTVKRIKKLFSEMSEVDAKFPRRMQITFIGTNSSEVYFSNGRYVRRDHRVYKLPDSQEYDFFQSLIVRHN